MLKNLSPLLSGALLTTLDEMNPGDWLTLTNSDYPEELISPPVVQLGAVTTEEAAAAILSVMPLDETEPSPIVFLDETGTVEDLPDVAFAVRGLAADAELRPIQLKHATAEEFFRLAEHSVASVRVESDAPPCAFLLRKGMT